LPVTVTSGPDCDTVSRQAMGQAMQIISRPAAVFSFI